MKWLGWDTSLTMGAIVALDATGVIAKVQLNLRKESLLKGIDQVLKDAGWSPQELSGVAVGTGPGSFTGLRIGIVTARTFAKALKIPLVPLRSLEILAIPSLIEIQNTKGPVFFAICQNAFQQEMYSLSGLSKDFLKEEVVDPTQFVDTLILKLEENSKLQWAIVGDAQRVFAEIFGRLPEDRKYPLRDIELVVEPGALGQRMIERLAETSPPETVLPRYLKVSSAERSRAGG